MLDMRKAIVIKTDQLNADDLLSGSRTIRIRDVVCKESGEQRAHIFFDGDNNKPYKPNTSMLKILCAIWGPDGAQWVGRSMTLFNDKTVKWAGQPVGGIRISHMSHIEDVQVNTIAVTRGQKKPYTVKPLKAEQSPQSELNPADVLAAAKVEAAKGKEAFTAYWNGPAKIGNTREILKPHMAELSELSTSADADSDASDEVPFD